MSSSQSTVDFIVEQIQKAGDIRYRKMFGDYALYCNDKVIGLICDDQLFIKKTALINNYLDDSHIAPPFPGAKNFYRVPEDNWDDAEWLTELARETAALLPIIKLKKKH